ncbi:MAG: peptidoglycan-associated lipoprotein Pal [Nitrospirota bacterium]
MKRFMAIFLVVLGLVTALGCAQKRVAQAPEQPVQPGVITEDKQKAAVPEAGEAGRERITEQQPPKTEQADLQAPPKELPVTMEDIYFDYDQYAVRDDAKPVLKDLAKFLSNNRNAKVVIEGHCDERGTDEYNLALGDKRAHSVREFLIALGIPSSRIDTVSYGEERPLCTESTEACWAKNRRAHFVLVEGK